MAENAIIDIANSTLNTEQRQKWKSTLYQVETMDWGQFETP